MKVLVALDSFKGSISSKEANEAVKKALDDHDVICKAIGDGGENTMEAIADSLNGNIEQVEVCGPLNNKIIASYAICNDLAVIEMAKCAICEKGPHFGNAVSHSHRRSNKVWNANVKSVRVKVNGAAKKMYVCTSCLRSGKVERA